MRLARRRRVRVVVVVVARDAALRVEEAVEHGRLAALAAGRGASAAPRAGGAVAVRGIDRALGALGAHRLEGLAEFERGRLLRGRGERAPARLDLLRAEVDADRRARARLGLGRAVDEGRGHGADAARRGRRGAGARGQRERRDVRARRAAPALLVGLDVSHEDERGAGQRVGREDLGFLRLLGQDEDGVVPEQGELGELPPRDVVPDDVVERDRVQVELAAVLRHLDQPLAHGHRRHDRQRGADAENLVEEANHVHHVSAPAEEEEVLGSLAVVVLRVDELGLRREFAADVAAHGPGRLDPRFAGGGVDLDVGDGALGEGRVRVVVLRDDDDLVALLDEDVVGSRGVDDDGAVRGPLQADGDRVVEGARHLEEGAADELGPLVDVDLVVEVAEEAVEDQGEVALAGALNH
mmetsp:Transcript_18681/g.58744  ORF Transcript_18681/g.58744 Transcript_18681/m.58744 type:complete len:411 (-) Transcript_18681:1333-2565(-)